MDTSVSPYLQGNYAPVPKEYSVDQSSGGLRVEGDIPAHLVGAFMRNGRSYGSVGRIRMPDRAVMHDLQICGDYVVIFYPPAFTNLEAGLTGGNPFNWHADQPTRSCAISRNGEPVWFEKSSFFSGHFTNGLHANWMPGLTLQSPQGFRQNPASMLL